jgi:transposase
MFTAKLMPCLVVFEACGSAHYWSREMEALGHESKLIAPQNGALSSNAKRTMLLMPKQL